MSHRLAYRQSDRENRSIKVPSSKNDSSLGSADKKQKQKQNLARTHSNTSPS